ncbi:MAG TPA: hypothetical protein VGQ18_05615 [Gemmatimonadales bacterium]|jgi:tetratricopeptide (TPR) repeat protein|nr:hypothetical protein [Gemmatimonadales bacterium]
MVARAAVALVALCVSRVGAAGAQVCPADRPHVDAAADSNDWEAHFDRGVELLRNRHQKSAEAAFLWASRLDPRRAEPLLARWAAAWARDGGRFAEHLNHDPRKPEPPEALRIDSLRDRALMRNPLAYQSLILLAYNELPGSWRDNQITRAWFAYSNLEFENALSAFGALVAQNPERYRDLRFLRATVYVAMTQVDSATAEITKLLEALRREDTATSSSVYQSKALLEYALGLLHTARRDFPSARAALERAVIEDLAFYPAHLALGRLADAQRDSRTALEEFGRAAEIAPTDPVTRYEYGAALAQARRGPEAAQELRAAVALEPCFADSYYWLGEALMQQADTASALEDFRTYAAHAARAAPLLGVARQRIARLGGRP